MSYIEKIATLVKEQIPKSSLPSGDTSALFALYAVLVLIKGQNVSREDVHHAWSAWMFTIDPEHKSIVPFSELSEETKAQDQPFVDAIKAVSALMTN